MGLWLHPFSGLPESGPASRPAWPCGNGDLRFRDFVRGLPLDLTYEEGPGEHNWEYWDKMIQNVLAWMFPQGKNL